MDENIVKEKAIKWVKENKKTICSKFADISLFPSVEKPSAYFMAGSPGAGKTEYSISFIKILCEKEPTRKIVRIDADEIRNLIPDYNRKNAYLMQAAASVGVNKLLDHVLHNEQDFLMDGTFASYSVSYKNITRCIHDHRKIGLIYIYQDPMIAWEYTVKREAVEGRNIPKEAFIKAFFDSKINVEKIKKEYQKEIELTVIIRDIKQGIEKSHFNVDNVDSYLKIRYNENSLITLLGQSKL